MFLLTLVRLSCYSGCMTKSTAMQDKIEETLVAGLEDAVRLEDAAKDAWLEAGRERDCMVAALARFRKFQSESHVVGASFSADLT
jgi:hypothetical protein